MDSSDYIIRALSTSGGIRILACSLPILARQVCAMQQTSATATIALGRGLAAGALMGALLKPDQRVALKFEGNGALRKLIIEAEYGGVVRGCVGNATAEAEPVNGRWNVPAIIGKAGFLTVSKDIGMGGQPYHGTVQLQTSEIGDDLAFYLTDSEQIPSAVGLTASIDDQGTISGCGGFLVQALPGATEEQINAVMTAIAGIASVGELLAQGGLELLIEKLFAGDSYTLLEQTVLQFRCSCDEHKVMRALTTLPKEEIALMIAEKQATEVSCEFCRQRYIIEPEKLGALLADINAAVRTVEDA